EQASQRGRGFINDHHAYFGNSARALVRSIAVRRASDRKPDSCVLTASATTRALAKGKSVPNTIRSGRATWSSEPKVASPGASALSYQKCARPAATPSRESGGSRGSIIGDTESRHAK